MQAPQKQPVESQTKPEGGGLGVRGRLLLFTLPVFAAAFLLVWAVTTATSRSGLTAMVDANLKLAAENLADAMTRSLSDSRADAVTTARLDLAAEAIETYDPKNIQWYADELVRTKNKYAAVVVADEDGTIVAANSVDSNGDALDVDLRDREMGSPEWLRKAFESERNRAVLVPPSRPEFLQGVLAPQERVVGFSLPVLDIIDARIGTITLFVSLRYFAERLDQYHVGGADGFDSTAVLVDANGSPVVQASSLAGAYGWQGFTLPEPSQQTAMRWQGPNATTFHVARAPVEGPLASFGWRLATLKTSGALERPVDALTGRLQLVFIGALLVATAVLALVASRFVAPIQRLTRAIASTGRASEFAELPVETGDEVGQLTRSFNGMMQTIRGYEQDLEAKVEERTQKLAEARQEVKDILDNMAEGIFTVNAAGKINAEYSAACRSILGLNELSGVPFLPLLQLQAESEGYSRMRFWLENIIGGDELQWTLAEDDPLKSVEYLRPDTEELAALELEYAPIFKDDVVDKIMVIARDVTRLKGLETEVERKDQENKQNLARVSEIVNMQPELFYTFIRESEGILTQCDEEISALRSAPNDMQPIHQLFRYVHTLKGNARIFKLSTIQNAAHELEEYLARARERTQLFASDDVDDLAVRFEDLKHLLTEFQRLGKEVLGGAEEAEQRSAGTNVPESRILELRRAYKELARVIDASGGSIPDDVERRYAELGAAVQELTRVPVAETLEQFKKMVVDLARDLGKRVEDPNITGGDIKVDSKLIELMRDVLMHALRNSVDHGIEPSSERAAAGKPEKGRIGIHCSNTEDGLVFEVSDDGAGIDLERVRARAFERRLVDEAELDGLGQRELIELLFQPGFSTAARVSDVSGRGVGLDVVRTTMRKLQGDAYVHTKAGEGTTLRLWIPRDYYERL